MRQHRHLDVHTADLLPPPTKYDRYHLLGPRDRRRHRALNLSSFSAIVCAPTPGSRLTLGARRFFPGLLHIAIDETGTLRQERGWFGHYICNSTTEPFLRVTRIFGAGLLACPPAEPHWLREVPVPGNDSVSATQRIVPVSPRKPDGH